MQRRAMSSAATKQIQCPANVSFLFGAGIVASHFAQGNIFAVGASSRQNWDHIARRYAFALVNEVGRWTHERTLRSDFILPSLRFFLRDFFEIYPKKD